MIAKLTDKQIERFPYYVKKWTDIGLSTAPLNRVSVCNALRKLYGIVGKECPKPVICTSPLALWLTIGFLRNSSVSASVRDSVRDSVSDSVSASVHASVSASVYWYYDFGQFIAYWLSFYDFMRMELDQDTSKLDGNEALCLSAGWSVLFWKLAFIGEKPISIHRNNAGRLHKDGAPSVEYSDGWGVYALNGIRMKADYVLTPAEQLKPEIVLQETNVDVRRELLRKIGIERMLDKLEHKVLEKRGTYEVLKVKLSEQVNDARYLRMLNPSVGCWHLEGIPAECDTVEKALNWRNNNWQINAEILT